MRTVWFLSSLLACCIFTVGAAWGKEPFLGAGTDDVKLAPTFETIPGPSYAIWQIPRSPVAVLFVAHGANHGSEMFWDRSPSCTICSPLPEERAIIKAALARGYAVITVQALTKWDLSANQHTNPDFLMVSAFLQAWRKEHSLDSLPFTIWGLSRGGGFGTVLALGVKTSGIVVMISRGGDDALQAAAHGRSRFPYPQLLFIYMPKDAVLDGLIQERIELLSSEGFVVGDIKCHPFPIYESYFTERIPGLSFNVSSHIFQALEANGFLTPEGFVNQPADPVDWEVYGRWDWVRVLRSLRVLDKGGGEWLLNAVAEELNLSFGFHCCTSLKASLMLDWLDSTWQNKQQPGVAVQVL